MEINVTFPETPNQTESLTIQKKLGKGKFSVYQVSSSLKNSSYALKIFPRSKSGRYYYDKERRFSHLAHPNIIKQIPMKCSHDDYYVHMTELAQYGDFHEVVVKKLIQDNEMLIRTYFQQLIKGIEYLHSQGIAHLDLKLENLVIGEDYQLKIIDFDQAHFLNQTQVETRGTPCFRAPELIDETCEDFISADVYSIGVILFGVKTGEFPFMEVEKGEKIERVGSEKFKKDNKGFWKKQRSHLQALDFLSSDFIQLMNGLLQEDPKDRLRIQDIKASKWYSGPVLSPTSLKSKMSIRIYKSNLKESKAKTPKTPKTRALKHVFCFE